MNINFTQNKEKIFRKLHFPHIWKITACLAISVALAEGYWICHLRSSSSHNSLYEQPKEENTQFVASFSKLASSSFKENDSLKPENPRVIIPQDSGISNVDAGAGKKDENVAISSPFAQQIKQNEQTKELLIAWLKQNMALVNDIRKVLYRIEYAKQKSKQVQDSIKIIAPNLIIIEDSVELWGLRGNNIAGEVADNQISKTLSTLQKQEAEWQKKLTAAKQRSENWQSVLHQYNEKLNFYKAKK